MEVREFFPIWDKLNQTQQERIRQTASIRQIEAGRVVHNGEMDCLGLLLIEKGQLRVYSVSEEGREVTLYRLFERDTCLFSASCMMPDIQFEVIVEAEKDTKVWVLPTGVIRKVQEESAPMANYMYQLMASRFSDVMWTMEQIMWKSFDKRLAALLVEEMELAGSPCLCMTHEKMANHLGSAREVVTRMLKYFQNEGMVRLTRGAVEITREEALRELAEG